MTTLTRLRAQLPVAIDEAQRLEYALIGAWALAMICLPIALWTIGDTAFVPGITFAAILQASAAFYTLQRQWGLGRALRTLALVGLLAWFAEFIGSKTGFPFGAYNYTLLLQPQLWGVPVLIPIAWFMLLPSAWVMAQLILGEVPRNRYVRVLYAFVSAAALTAWDLFLDPQMVARGFWVWEETGAYFGIPLSNYAGWLLTAFVVTLVVNPARLNVMPLALVYGMVWFLQSIGQAIFWGQPGPALVGSLAMGSIMLLAYWRQKARQQ
jgi:lycopene beta-cyclase